MTLGPKWCGVGFTPQVWVNAAITTPGEETTPNPVLLLKRNSVSPSPRPTRGRGAARRTDAVAGRGGRRKRMPRCNGADTGMQHARRRKLCRLPSGRSSRDDRHNPRTGNPARLAPSRAPNRRRVVSLAPFGEPSTALLHKKEDSMKMHRHAVSASNRCPTKWRSRHVQWTVWGTLVRIAKAAREGKWRRVQPLQRMPTHSSVTKTLPALQKVW